MNIPFHFDESLTADTPVFLGAFSDTDNLILSGIVNTFGGTGVDFGLDVPDGISFRVEGVEVAASLECEIEFGLWEESDDSFVPLVPFYMIAGQFHQEKRFEEPLVVPVAEGWTPAFRVTAAGTAQHVIAGTLFLSRNP